LIEVGELTAGEIVTIGVARSFAIYVAIYILILSLALSRCRGLGHRVGGLGVRGRDCDGRTEGEGYQPILSAMSDKFHKSKGLLRVKCLRLSGPGMEMHGAGH
jgi:hypothetical protein